MLTLTLILILSFFFGDGSTWIVITLIIVACAVAVGEISARFIVGANRTAEERLRIIRTAQLLVAQSQEAQSLGIREGGSYLALPESL